MYTGGMLKVVIIQTVTRKHCYIQEAEVESIERWSFKVDDFL